jgi:phosphate:Na+ symporter
MSDLGYYLVKILAGLGLFFVGIKMLGHNLRDMAGGPFRAAVRKVSANSLIASVWGVIAGFLTQSGRTTTLILASLVQGGIVSVKMTLPISLWSNLGCTLIVFSTIIPIDFFILFLLGIAGITLAFEKPKSFLRGSGAVFGLALMLYGLKMISGSAKGFTEFDWFEQLLVLTNSSLMIGLVIGLGLTMIAQSHMGIVLITLTMTSSGFFDYEHAAMILLGTHLGSAGITALTGLNFRGRPRQLVVSQIAFNLVAVILFLILFVVEDQTDVPLVHALSTQITPSTQGQLVFFLLLLNGATALLLTVVKRPYLFLCERFAPPSEFEDHGRAEFLNSELLKSPSTALVMCDQEQLRLLRRIPALIDTFRVDGEASKTPYDMGQQHQAFQAVSIETHDFLTHLAARKLTTADTERLLRLQNRQELLNTLEETCIRLAEEFEATVQDSALLQFRSSITEALDLQVLTAISALEGSDAMETTFLIKMTEDGSQTLENIRKEFLERSTNLVEQERAHILAISRLFERAAWALHHYALLLQQDVTVSTA